MAIKRSVVMPIHNEEKYLPYSLSSLKKCPIDELIIVLDRCTDKSETIIDSFSMPFDVLKIHKEKQLWRSCTAEVFEMGFSNTKGDILYSMAGDFLIDPNQFNLEHFENADFVSFFYYNLDLMGRFKYRQQWLNFMKKHINITRLWKGAIAQKTGHFAFKREVWEDLHIRDVPSEYDDFMVRALKKGFRYKFISNIRNYHLRVGLSKDRQFLQGMSRAQGNRCFLPTLAHSIVFMKPYLFISYLYEKQYHLFETQKWGKNGNA